MAYIRYVQVRSFYAESRLLTNEKIKRELGIKLLYPTCKTHTRARPRARMHTHTHTHTHTHNREYLHTLTQTCLCNTYADREGQVAQLQEEQSLGMAPELAPSTKVATASPYSTR